MDKILSVFLSFLLSVIAQAPVIKTANMTVAEGFPATVETKIVEVNKPTKIMTVVATAYCSCKTCCGIYAENRPNGVVYTASGAVAKANRTIAVDTSVIPFGTRIEYNGNIYVAEDTGAFSGNRIDIYFEDHSAALNFGRQTIEVEVLE